MDELNTPDTWAISKLEVLPLLSRGQVSSANEVDVQSCLVEMEDIEKDTGKISFEREIPKKMSTKNVFRAGDVLYGKLRPYLNKCGVAEVNGICSSEIYVIDPLEMNSKFLAYYLRSPLFLNYASTQTHGARMPRLSRDLFEEAVFPVPPKSEQERIVQKIEACFEKIEETENNINEVEILLGKYRESLIAKAFRGELVPQILDDEPASVMLTKLRKEREKYKSAKENLELIPISDEEKPFEIPASWEWVRFGDITENLDGKRVPIKSEDREKRKGEYPYYGASGIIDYFDDYIYQGEHLLISEDGANLLARTYPIAFIATGKFWVNNHAHVVRALNCTSNRYLELYFEMLDLSKWVTGSAQPKFNQAKLNSVPIPLPPINEQARIITILDDKLSLQEKTYSDLKTKKEFFGKMKESILSQAFEGNLVEQIESEGSGQELLNNILTKKIKQESLRTTKMIVTKKTTKK